MTEILLYLSHLYCPVKSAMQSIWRGGGGVSSGTLSATLNHK